MRHVTFFLLFFACSTAQPIGGDSETPPVDASQRDSSNEAETDAAAMADASTTSPDAAPASLDAAVPVCPTDPCDLVEQCGCAAGEACDLAADPLAGNDCRTVAAAGVETDSCDAPTDCAAGYTCVGDGAGSAACKRFCNAGSSCSQPRGQCVIQLVSSGTEIPGALTCSSGCDPTRASAGDCPADHGCFLYTVNPDGVANSGDELSLVDCAPAGDGLQGAGCTAYEDCAPDHLCTGVGLGLSQCLRLCSDVGSACPAEAGTSCTGFTMPHEVGGTEYGVCF